MTKNFYVIFFFSAKKEQKPHRNPCDLWPLAKSVVQVCGKVLSGDILWCEDECVYICTLLVNAQSVRPQCEDFPSCICSQRLTAGALQCNPLYPVFHKLVQGSKHDFTSKKKEMKKFYSKKKS